MPVKETYSLIAQMFTMMLRLIALEGTIRFLTELQFLSVGTTPGVSTTVVPRADDGFSEAIPITGGLVFGEQVHNVIYVRSVRYTTILSTSVVTVKLVFSLFRSTQMVTFLLLTKWMTLVNHHFLMRTIS